MPQTFDIETLEKSVEEERINFEQRKQEFEQEIREKEKTIMKLKEMLNIDTSNNKSRIAPQPTRQLTITAQKHAVEKPYTYNFTETVKSIVYDFSGKEFTVAIIEKLLKEEVGKNVPKNPRSRIAMVLKGFIRKGIVQCTYEGTGSNPYRYREAQAKQSSYRANYKNSSHSHAHA